jgi:hypothetical protein
MKRIIAFLLPRPVRDSDKPFKLAEEVMFRSCPTTIAGDEEVRPQALEVVTRKPINPFPFSSLTKSHKSNFSCLKNVLGDEGSLNIITFFLEHVAPKKMKRPNVLSKNLKICVFFKKIQTSVSSTPSIYSPLIWNIYKDNIFLL